MTDKTPAAAIDSAAALAQQASAKLDGAVAAAQQALASSDALAGAVRSVDAMAQKAMAMAMANAPAAWDAVLESVRAISIARTSTALVCLIAGAWTLRTAFARISPAYEAFRTSDRRSEEKKAGAARLASAWFGVGAGIVLVVGFLAHADLWSTAGVFEPRLTVAHAFIAKLTPEPAKK